MKTRHICGIILLAGLTAVSCYEDKGDYDYHEINEVTISLQKTMDVTVPHEGSVTVTLSPEITQSMRDGDEGLVCEWRKREGTDSFVWKVCGDEKILKVSVPSRSTDNLYYRFAAKDSETGVTTYAEISLRMVNPLENAWFVLQDVDGRTVVGAVDGSGETAAIHRDIYAYLKGDGAQIEGTPRAIRVNPDLRHGLFDRALSVIYLLTSEGGGMFDSRTMDEVYGYRELLLGLREDETIDPEFVKSDKGEIIINGGRMWYASEFEYSVYYPVKLGETLGSEYYLTQAMSFVNEQTIVYDRAGGRFLWYNRFENPSTLYGELVRNGELQYYDVDGSYNRARLKSVGELPDFPNAFDPDRLGDREVLFMGTHSYMGIGASDMQGLAIACSPGSPQWTLYTFSDDGLYYGSSPRCPAVTTFTPSAGHRAEEWSFATSCFYNNVFFYGSGNRVYRVDLNSTIPLETLIYELPDATSRIVKMNFRHERYASMAYDLETMTTRIGNQPYWLGLAVEHADGTGSVVEMKLRTSGELSRENGREVVHTYDGFGKIVDFAYSFHPQF